MDKDETQIEQIYEFMQEYAIRAGEILMSYRGKVVNKPKDASRSAGADQEEGGLALTVVDEIIQEGFLWELSRFNFSPNIRINCEEETTLRELFRENKGELCTVHQDPCDGTKPYLDGKNDFATGYGISDPQNNFTHTVIYAPARDKLYVASPDSDFVFNKNEEDLETTVTQSKPNYKRIFSKRVLNERGKQEAKKAELSVEDIESTHCRIIDVALGNAGACLYGKSNPHDSFVPYAFAKARETLLFDINGRPINGQNIVVNYKNGFPVFERVPSVVYINAENPHKDVIMNILSDTRNLDETVL